MRKTTFFLLLGSILTMNVNAQKDPSVINSSGGSATYKTVTYEWSVGEMATESYITSSLVINEGFLQPVILKDTRIDQSFTDHKKILVYPAYGNQRCYLETDFGKPGKLNYLLVDLNGRKLVEKSTKISEQTSKETINLSIYPDGLYLLKVSFNAGDETITQTFKIQK